MTTTRLDNALNGLSESARQMIMGEIKKAVNKQVKKEIAKRRKKLAHKLIVTGLVFTGGCILYVASDKIAEVLIDRALTPTKKQPVHRALPRTKPQVKKN